MRSFLANALVTAGLLLPLCLYAQPRGSSRPSFSGSRGSFHSGFVSPRTHPIPRQARPVRYAANFTLSIPPVRGTSLINPGEASCTLNPSYSGSPYCRQFSPRGANYGIEPVYPFWMPSGPVESEEAPAPVAQPQTDPQLADQVGNLASQVEMMREEQAQRDYRGPAPPAAAEPQPPPTVLVYRDGHQVEVHNYAIVGKTIWVISDQTTQRVPLADLDLASTQRANAERGVDFSTSDLQ